jgi:hypothetical protein
MPLAIAALACSASGGGAASPPATRGLPPDATLRRDPATGVIRFLSGPDLSRGLDDDPAFRAAREHGDAAAVATAFVAAHADAFRLERPAEELVVRALRPDRDGRRIVVLDQRWRGLPVLGGELRVHLDAESRVVVVTGSTIPTPSGVDVEPGLDAAAARERAAAALGRPPGACGDCGAELAIAPGDRAPRLVWRVRPARGALHDELWLDARSGVVVERVPVALPSARTRDPETPR